MSERQAPCADKRDQPNAEHGRPADGATVIGAAGSAAAPSARRPGALRFFWRAPQISVQQQNITRLYLDIAWWGVAAGVTSTYLTVFAIRLGASTSLVGWLTAIPALVLVFWSIPSSRFAERQSQHLPMLLWSAFFHRFGWLLIALTPLFLRTHLPLALVVLTAISAIPASTASVAFTTLFADVVPPELRSRVVSTRNVLVSAVSLGTLLLLGAVLDKLPFPASYQLMFGLAWATSMVSLYHVSKLRGPTRPLPPRPRAERRPLAPRARGLVRSIVAERNFTRFTLASLGLMWGMNFPIPLYSIYRVRELHASDGWVALLSVVFSAVNIVAFFAWGRMGSRWSDRKILLISAAGLAAYPFLLASFHSLPPQLFVNVVGGVFSAGSTLAIFNEMLAVCPEAHRPRFIAVYAALTNVAVFFAPLAGAVTADWLGVRPAIVVGCGFRVASVLLLAWLCPVVDRTASPHE